MYDVQVGVDLPITRVFQRVIIRAGLSVLAESIILHEEGDFHKITANGFVGPHFSSAVLS